jgi:hypothetical protein
MLKDVSVNAPKDNGKGRKYANCTFISPSVLIKQKKTNYIAILDLR